MDSIEDAITSLRDFLKSTVFITCRRKTSFFLVLFGIVLAIAGGVSVVISTTIARWNNTTLLGVLGFIIFASIGFAIGDEIGLKTKSCRRMLEEWKKLIGDVFTQIENTLATLGIKINLTETKKFVLSIKMPRRIHTVASLLATILSDIINPTAEILNQIKEKALPDEKKAEIKNIAYKLISVLENFKEIYEEASRIGVKRSRTLTSRQEQLELIRTIID